MSSSRFLVLSLFLSLFLVAGSSALSARSTGRARPAQPPQPPAQAAPVQPVPPMPAPSVPPGPQPNPAVALPPASPKSLADVQVLLDRASYSSGVIDGRGGSNTRKAIGAFQAAHDLPVTGKVDPATWQNLTAAAGQQALVLYTLQPADVAGPFVEIPQRIEDQAKLPALGYTSPLELLGEKFHCAPELLKALNPGVDFSAAGQAIKVPNVAPFVPWSKDQPLPEKAALANVRVVVSKSESTLTVESGDDVIFFAPVTAGSEHDPLPLGEWKINGISRAPVFHFNPKLFWDAKPTDTKATVPAGPNNPVGAVWIDLSKDHYGIHGTPEPQLIGKTLSHGCVRMTNWDAQAVAALVKPGTPVLFEP